MEIAPNRRTLRIQALTLIEVMVVCAIVAILMGILLPVLIRSRRQAMWATDLSTMKQVAEAGALYANDFGEAPYCMDDLVSSGLFPANEAKLHLDAAPEGLANLIAKRSTRMPNLASVYSQSFLSLRHFNYTRELAEQRTHGLSPGWAIADLDYTMTPHDRQSEFGTVYWRIQNDGSISRRAVPSKITLGPDGQIQTLELNWIDFFVDPER
jgi:prepilin-type N-terminal cleavage/methylation domain-containing protein